MTLFSDLAQSQQSQQQAQQPHRRGAAMIRAALLAVMLTGCAGVPPIGCKLPRPPEILLTVPPPLPPVPADLVPR
jgi:hypothetical protein